jgi:hypothetical protein
LVTTAGASTSRTSTPTGSAIMRPEGR